MVGAFFMLKLNKTKQISMRFYRIKQMGEKAMKILKYLKKNYKNILPINIILVWYYIE
jgi:hypothetical protein